MIGKRESWMSDERGVWWVPSSIRAPRYFHRLPKSHWPLYSQNAKKNKYSRWSKNSRMIMRDKSRVFQQGLGFALEGLWNFITNQSFSSHRDELSGQMKKTQTQIEEWKWQQTKENNPPRITTTRRSTYMKTEDKSLVYVCFTFTL